MTIEILGRRIGSGKPRVSSKIEGELLGLVEDESSIDERHISRWVDSTLCFKERFVAFFPHVQGVLTLLLNDIPITGSTFAEVCCRNLRAHQHEILLVRRS